MGRSVFGLGRREAIIDGQTINLDGDATPTADLVTIGSGDTTATANVDALNITLITAEGATGSNLLNLNATFASTTNNSTNTVLNIANITATSTTNNLIATGISVGSMTEAGTGTVSSSGLFISSGWDNAINVNNSKFTVTPAGITSVNFNSTATTNGVCHSGSDLDAASDTTEALVACNNGAGDLAEWYETEQNVEVGDVVALTDAYFTYEATRVDPFTGLIAEENGRETIAILGKSQESYSAKIFGVISGSPVQTIGGDIQKQGRHPLPVALSGRVPVKVTDENGAIGVGDYLVSSSLAGHAMKTARSGKVIGIALENWESGNGQIMMLVNNFYWHGPDELTASQGSDGLITVAEHNLNMNGYAILEVGRIAGISGVWSISQDGQLQVRDLTVGSPERPTGITLHDEVTGSPSCVSLRNGGVVVRPGACGTPRGSSESSEASKSSEASAPSPQPSPAGGEGDSVSAPSPPPSPAEGEGEEAGPAVETPVPVEPAPVVEPAPAPESAAQTEAAEQLEETTAEEVAAEELPVITQ
ncbi:hypothetical protein HYW17_05885 [Candidatus Uhrbacteria bacterium]|nr:hypothetical protein [Candidatus Uhrbacteria bacterium]